MSPRTIRCRRVEEFHGQVLKSARVVPISLGPRETSEEDDAVTVPVVFGRLTGTVASGETDVLIPECGQESGTHGPRSSSVGEFPACVSSPWPSRARSCLLPSANGRIRRRYDQVRARHVTRTTCYRRGATRTATSSCRTAGSKSGRRIGGCRVAPPSCGGTSRTPSVDGPTWEPADASRRDRRVADDLCRRRGGLGAAVREERHTWPGAVLHVEATVRKSPTGSGRGRPRSMSKAMPLDARTDRRRRSAPSRTCSGATTVSRS